MFKTCLKIQVHESMRLLFTIARVEIMLKQNNFGLGSWYLWNNLSSRTTQFEISRTLRKFGHVIYLKRGNRRTRVSFKCLIGLSLSATRDGNTIVTKRWRMTHEVSAFDKSLVRNVITFFCFFSILSIPRNDRCF